MHVRSEGLRLAAAALGCAAALAACGNDGGGDGGPDGKPGKELAVEGKSLYQETCAACHGSDLEGTDDGPPFLDVVYAPDHHSDESFYAAVENGVQPHHWEFGPMPAQPSVDPEEVAAIVAFVRREQAKAGIIEDPSH